MRLIGMMDPPYVRRVAVSLKMLGIPFAHDQVSVFRHFNAFAKANPVVKAPTLVTDEGVVLMDSTLILDFVERTALAERSLMPRDVAAYARAQRIVGLALVACEKTLQIVYEQQLRPGEKQHQPWLERIGGQLRCAYELLDAELENRSDTPWLFGDSPLQPDITAAIAWTFTHHMLPGLVSGADHPAIATLAERAEALPQFTSSPLE